VGCWGLFAGPIESQGPPSRGVTHRSPPRVRRRLPFHRRRPTM